MEWTTVECSSVSAATARPKGLEYIRIPSGFFSTRIIFLSILAFAIAATIASALPDGVTIVPIRNDTSSPTAGGMINTTGGSITTVNLNASTQNVRWKAFIGNVSGTLTLDDSAGASIYSWSLASISGEVYATRNPGSVNWTGINCSNLTHLSNEEVALGHTNKDDNITTTFNVKNHSSFFVDVRPITNNTCQSVHTYVNSTAQDQRFEEVALYDGTNLTNGNIIYSTILEQDKYGYNNKTYDFQMIVPERGEPTWQSATAYYFYVELS